MTTPAPKGGKPEQSPGGHTQPHALASLDAPWRLAYLEALDARPPAGGAEQAAPAGAEHAKPTAPGASTSFLEDAFRNPAQDRERHIVLRSALGLIMLNKYPYTNGHLLVALGEARPTLLDYDPSQRAHLWQLSEVATDLVQRTLQPQGINIGINQGRAAGAGLPNHLHVHLVPRWGGDVNFMQVVGQVKVIPGSLDAMWERYVSAARSMRA